jgi:hypothetical protein
MTIEELRAGLAATLALEDRPDADWEQVEAQCRAMIARLNTEPEPTYPHDIVYHFLEDADARQKSSRYAEGQRERLRQWLKHEPQNQIGRP